MARKKRPGPGRMFTREQRAKARSEQLQRAAQLTPADVDRGLIEQYFGSPPVSALQVAEAWSDLAELGEDATDQERTLRHALARELHRLAGRNVSEAAVKDLVKELRAAAEDADEDEREERWWHEATPLEPKEED